MIAIVIKAKVVNVSISFISETKDRKGLKSWVSSYVILEKWEDKGFQQFLS